MFGKQTFNISVQAVVGDTVFVAAVDKEGNVAALIQSLYFTFGSGVVAGDTAFRKRH